MGATLSSKANDAIGAPIIPVVSDPSFAVLADAPTETPPVALGILFVPGGRCEVTQGTPVQDPFLRIAPPSPPETADKIKVYDSVRVGFEVVPSTRPVPDPSIAPRCPNESVGANLCGHVPTWCRRIIEAPLRHDIAWHACLRDTSTNEWSLMEVFRGTDALRWTVGRPPPIGFLATAQWKDGPNDGRYRVEYAKAVAAPRQGTGHDGRWHLHPPHPAESTAPRAYYSAEYRITQPDSGGAKAGPIVRHLNFAGERGAEAVQTRIETNDDDSLSFGLSASVQYDAVVVGCHFRRDAENLFPECIRAPTYPAAPSPSEAASSTAPTTAAAINELAPWCAEQLARPVAKDAIWHLCRRKQDTKAWEYLEMLDKAERLRIWTAAPTEAGRKAATWSVLGMHKYRRLADGSTDVIDE